MNSIEELQPVCVRWLTGGQGFYRLLLEPNENRPFFVVVDEYNDNQKIRVPVAGVMMVLDVTEAVYQKAIEDIKQQAKGIKRPKLITPM